jgi:hypothetical protein
LRVDVGVDVDVDVVLFLQSKWKTSITGICLLMQGLGLILLPS